MKQLTQLLLLTVLLLATSCQKEEENQLAQVAINSDLVDSVVIRNPMDDIYIWDMKNDTISSKTDSVFLFQRETVKPVHVQAFIGNERVGLILLPQERVEVDYLDSTIVYKGKNKEGQKFLNSLVRPFFDMNESSKYRSDTTAVQIKNKIELQKQAEIRRLQVLIDSSLVDKAFGSVLDDEINAFYALRTVEAVMVKQYYGDAVEKDLLNLYDETLEQYPLAQDYKSSSWLEYANQVILYKEVYDRQQDGILSKDYIQKLSKEDKWIPYQFEIIKEYPDQDIAEKVAANFIMSSTKQQGFEESLISVFEDFKSTYPESAYTEHLKPEIDVIADYHVKMNQAMPDDIKFIDSKEIGSLEDLMPFLENDKYYVDLWATWCGPCKREFVHNDDLSELLKAKGYKKLYVSIDREEARDKWKQDIKYYDLSGTHILANSDFVKNFADSGYSLIPEGMAIPQYMIIDYGKIITNDAARPSMLDVLEPQLTDGSKLLK